MIWALTYLFVNLIVLIYLLNLINRMGDQLRKAYEERKKNESRPDSDKQN